MSKGNYTHIKYLETEILTMKESGKAKCEIDEHYGLKTEQVKEWLKWYRRRKLKIASAPYHFTLATHEEKCLVPRKDAA